MNECDCTSPSEYKITICEGDEACPPEPCLQPSRFMVRVESAVTGELEYCAISPTAEGCREMLKSVGIEVTIPGKPGWE